MSGANKFKFISPGVQIKEIDRSQINNVSDAVGPVIVGRARRGPGMVPVKVRSYEEFVSIFGEPVRGSSEGDIWREGNLTAPMYSTWAAKAYLANSNPVTFIRLMGSSHPQLVEGAGEAGWKTSKSLSGSVGDDGGGAYGLFIYISGLRISYSWFEKADILSIVGLGANVVLALMKRHSNLGRTGTSSAHLNADATSLGST